MIDVKMKLILNWLSFNASGFEQTDTNSSSPRKNISRYKILAKIEKFVTEADCNMPPSVGINKMPAA